MDRNCPTCGAPIASETQGLCPACLLKEGMRPTEGHLDSLAPTEGDPIRAALEKKLQGHYRLIRLLGRGGMGSVYLARDLTLDREVAIKVVKTETGAPEVYERFRREAKTAAKLSHPNIVPLHAFGELNGMPYFVMGYVRGESLAARLGRDGRLPEDEARRVLAEIADALDHAHRQGIVHRDVKPDNVLLDDESGRAMLTDFGVAKASGKAETVTMRGSVVGTPQFMSPEQAAGRGDVDGRSDLYSLGVTAYAMLAGRLPFEGKSPGDVLAKQLTEEAPPLRTLATTLSDATIQVVERCLAKDPAKRWPDARSLRLAVGGAEDAELPDGLRTVQGRGFVGVVIAGLVVIAEYVVAFRLGHSPSFIWFGIGAMFASFYLFLLARLRREGFTVRQAQRAIWTEPAWWALWYPRSLRRRGNVWDRLPASVRGLRWCIPVFVVGIIAAPTLGGAGELGYEVEGVLYAVVAVLCATVVVWFVLKRRATAALTRKGLAPADIERMLLTPSSRTSFWGRPHLAAILTPLPRDASARPSDSPHDQLQSILRHADELSGPLRPLGAQAAAAARQLLASVDQSDRDVAELARNLEPGEDHRLADKIAALAPVPGRPDDHAPMRQLLEKQLDLIRGLESRIDATRQIRARHVEMLKTLTLHLATLRARAAETPTEVRSLSDRVQSLCDDIARQSLPLDAPGGWIDAQARR